MGWIRDLSTGAKLGLSFGLMAALIVLAGFVGVRGMAGLRDSFDALYEQGALGVSHIKEANIAVFATQGAVRAALLDEQAEKWEAEARKREADFQKSLTLYRATLADEAQLAKAK